MLDVFFWGFSGAAVASALLCVTRKSAVASALWLVGTMFALAALYVLLDAQFIAVIQVLVYAGAILVLFLFVIMLLNLTPTGLARIERPRLKVLLTSGFTRGRETYLDGDKSVLDRLKERLLPKPYERHELARAIRRTLDGDPPGL